MTEEGKDAVFSWKPALAVFLAALALRAVFVSQWLQLPYIHSLAADAWACDRWALDILEGGLVRHTAFYQSPFYPYFLAAFYKLAGHRPDAVLWFQAAADSVTCVLIMQAGRLCFGARAGLAAGLLAAFYRPFIFNTALLTKEVFALLALALFVLALLGAGRQASFRRLFLCGLAAGWCLLLRPNAALLAPAALLWLRLASPGTAGAFLRRALPPLLLGLLLPVLPATLHNYAASRDLVPLNYTGGFTLFIGNNPEATPFGSYPLGVSTDPLLEEKESTALAEKAAGRPLKPSEVSGYWTRRSLEHMVSHPLRTLGLVLQKLWFFWSWYEFSDNYDLQFITAKFSTALNLPLASFALAGCLSALGFFLCRLREPSGAVLLLFFSYLASILPFWICDRYRLPALVFLLPLAGGALAWLAEKAAARDFRTAARRCLLASPLMLVCLAPLPLNMDFAEASAWGQLTAVYSDSGDHRRALESFGEAARLAPGSLAAPVISAAAFSMQRLGRPEDALELYKLGIAVHPLSAMLHNNYGALLFRLGRAEEAAELLEKAAGLDVDPGPVYRSLFYVYRRLGRKEDALRSGALAAARMPEDAALLSDLESLRTKNR